MRSALFLLALLCTLLRPISSPAAVLFVDDSCVSSGTGTSNTCGGSGPFRTICEGVMAMQCGDTLNIRAGTYVEPIMLTSAATPICGKALACSANSRATIQGCRAPACPTDERPNIHGFQLRTWDNEGGGVYSREMEASPWWSTVEANQRRDEFTPMMLYQTNIGFLNLPTAHHYRDLNEVTMLAYAGDNVAEPTEGRWSYHPTTRRVYVHTIGDLNANDVIYVPHYSWGLYTRQPSGFITFRHLNVRGFRYSLNQVTSQGSQVVSDMEFHDVYTGYAMRFLNRVTNSSPNSRWTSNLTQHGCRGIDWSPTSGDGCYTHRLFGVHNIFFSRNINAHVGTSGVAHVQGRPGRYHCSWCDPPWNDPTHTMFDHYGDTFNIKVSTGGLIEDNEFYDAVFEGTAIDASRHLTYDRNIFRRTRMGMSLRIQTASSGCPSSSNALNCYTHDITARRNIFIDVGGQDMNECGIGIQDGPGRHDDANFLIRLINTYILSPSFAGICSRREPNDTTPIQDVLILGATIMGQKAPGPSIRPAVGVLVNGPVQNFVMRNVVIDDVDSYPILLTTEASAVDFDYTGIGLPIAQGVTEVWWEVPPFPFTPPTSGGIRDTLANFRQTTQQEIHGYTGAMLLTPDGHLESDDSAAYGRGVSHALLTEDWDGDPREQDGANEGGADEFEGAPPTTTTIPTTTSTTAPGATTSTSTSSSTSTSNTSSTTSTSTSTTSSSTTSTSTTVTTSTSVPADNCCRCPKTHR